MNYRKNKHCSRLTDEHLSAILRISTSNLKAKIQQIASQIQHSNQPLTQTELEKIAHNISRGDVSDDDEYMDFSSDDEIEDPTYNDDAVTHRTKRLKTKDLRDSTPVSVLNYATQMGLRATGQARASKVLHEITSTSPNRANKYREAYIKSLSKQMMSGEDALAVLVDAKLSRHQYNIIRMSAPEKFPSYKIVQAAKKECDPNREFITVTSTCAEVALQALLDHTVNRLVLTLEPVIDSLNDEELEQLCLFLKWGFDGSSGHSSYKQAFHGLEASDSAVFITCLVPIRLVCGEKIVWQNPRPASTRYCRPLKIEFIKESNDISIIEKKRIDDQIKLTEEHCNN
ncbi:hypothetical protein RI129_003266 [Pyrocoelia pectoralis]|uniref:Uncharacterized protein n=1 Tax=Pyrocoelia pectoralis TaxID=417401 RepID=A0AAN7VQU0_9COLE